MEWIKRAWRGQERCWTVFWVYGVLGILGLGSAGRALALAGADAIMFVVVPAYTVWLLVSEYRCAFNLEWKLFGYVVRVFFVALPVALMVFVTVAGIRKGINTPRAARCEKVEHDLDYRATHRDLYERCMSRPLGAAAE